MNWSLDFFVIFFQNWPQKCCFLKKILLEKCQKFAIDLSYMHVHHLRWLVPNFGIFSIVHIIQMCICNLCCYLFWWYAEKLTTDFKCFYVCITALDIQINPLPSFKIQKYYDQYSQENWIVLAVRNIESLKIWQMCVYVFVPDAIVKTR